MFDVQADADTDWSFRFTVKKSRLHSLLHFGWSGTCKFDAGCLNAVTIRNSG
jgi:hypothetical protein